MVPIEPAPPGWLITTILVPSASSSSPAATRVTWSVAPPAAQGTMMLIGFVGFHCACAEHATASAAAVTTAFTAFMAPPPCSFRKVSQHERGHVPKALGLAARGQQVALENGRQRVAVAEIEVPERRDRDVELHRVDVAAEFAFARAALEQVLQHRHQ